MLIGKAASATVPYVASRYATAVTSIPCVFSALPCPCRGGQPLPRADRVIGRRGRRALRLMLELRFDAPHIRLHRAFNMSDFAEYQAPIVGLVIFVEVRFELGIPCRFLSADGAVVIEVHAFKLTSRNAIVLARLCRGSVRPSRTRCHREC